MNLLIIQVSLTDLQLFEILCLVVHLDFECVDLQQLSAFLCLIVAVGHSGRVQVANKLLQEICQLSERNVKDRAYLGKPRILLAIQPELCQLEIRFDRQALV